MSAGAGITRSWSVGKYRVTMTIPRSGSGLLAATVEWEPYLPKRLTDAELRQYRAGRDAALAEMAAELGVTVGLVEL